MSTIDERCREKILRAAVENLTNDARFRLAVNLANSFIEFNAFARNSIKKLCFPLIQLGLKFRLERADLIQKMLYPLVHTNSVAVKRLGLRGQ
jgi:hypothetical protein